MDFDRNSGQTQEHDGTVIQDGVLHLVAGLEAPALARRFLEEHRDHLPDDILGDAELALTELVTNAVKHGRDAILVRIRASPPGIGIAVSDEGPPISPAAVDHPAAPGPEATSGRGLFIVDTLASDWGVTQHPDSRGKTVWIELKRKA